jgi:hypothetical protein
MGATFLGMGMAAWAATAIAASAAMSFAASRNNAANMKNAYRWQRKQREEKKIADRITANQQIYQAQQNLLSNMGASGVEMGTGTSLLRISENLNKGEELLEMIDLGAQMDIDTMNFTLRGNLGKEQYARRVGLAQGVGQSLLTYGTFPR